MNMPRILITPCAWKRGLTDRHLLVASMARPGSCVVVTVRVRS